jgi:DNA-directed RNA polymerase specialized sigma24 family protein
MQIVTENPKINPQPDEISDLADAMFLDIWNALHYIKPNTKPYSYLYRAGYTCACRFFKKKITERQKAEEINAHVTEEYVLYHDSVTDHKVRTNNYD